MSAPNPGADTKVVIQFKAVGGAPILKADKVKISRDSLYIKVVDHLRRQVGQDSVFTFLRSAFSPSLDEPVGSLSDSFGTDGRLIVQYSCQPAWG